MKSFYGLSRLAGLLLQLCESSENFFTVLVGIHIGIDFGDLALGIDDEGVTGSELDQAEICERAVLLGDLVVGVRKQLEVQALLGAELLVRVDAVNADAQYHGVPVLILLLVALEVVRFNGAAAGHVFGIEVKDQPFALELVETDFAAVLGRKREIGSSGARLRHGSSMAGCRQKHKGGCDCGCKNDKILHSSIFLSI